MKILVATTTEDPTEPQSWSGIPWHLVEALKRVDGVDVTIVGPMTRPRRMPEAIRKAWFILRRKRYIWWREPRILRLWTAEMAERLRGVEADAVMTFGTVAPYCLPRDRRYVIFTDSTFRSNLDYYPTMTGVAERSVRLSEIVERDSFARAGHVVITSEWAAQSVIDDYGVDPARVSVAPIAANTVCDLDADRLEVIAKQRLDGPMKLLWIGVEWDRKGGDIAVATAAELHKRGVPVELHLVGRVPDLEPAPYLHVHGFLNFTTDRERAYELFLSSYALLLPTRAEDAGIVFAEAASFAMPSVAPATGGVPTMVRDGINGRLLPEGAGALAYADALCDLWADPDRYLELARSSRERFERELTWDAVVRAIVDRVGALER
jgi:glycosyltransferase involved in cell wall biosynthesis